MREKQREHRKCIILCVSPYSARGRPSLFRNICFIFSILIMLMKFNPVPVLAALLLLSSSVIAQQDDPFKLLLKTGTIIPEKNITADKINEISRKSPQTNGKSFLIIQFEKIPGETERRRLQLAGIELLDYIPKNAYTATVTGALNASLLQQVQARAVVTLTPEQKMQPSLAAGIYPSWAIKVGGTIDVLISFPKTFSIEEVNTALRQKNFDIVTTDLVAYRIIGLRVAITRLSELAESVLRRLCAADASARQSTEQSQPGQFAGNNT